MLDRRGRRFDPLGGGSRQFTRRTVFLPSLYIIYIEIERRLSLPGLTCGVLVKPALAALTANSSE
jgi:hypothetical protein